MTFISVVANQRFLTCMSDGCISCDGEPTGENNFKKFIKVDKNFIITFGGENRDMILQLIREAELTKPNGGNFVALADCVDKMFHSAPYKDWRISIGMGGINSRGQIEFIAVNSKDGRQHLLPTKEGLIRYVFFYLQKYSIDLPKEFIRFLGKTGDQTPAQVLAAQKLLNDKFAAINPTMNRNTFPAVISRG